MVVLHPLGEVLFQPLVPAASQASSSERFGSGVFIQGILGLDPLSVRLNLATVDPSRMEVLVRWAQQSLCRAVCLCRAEVNPHRPLGCP